MDLTFLTNKSMVRIYNKIKSNFSILIDNINNTMAIILNCW